MKKLITAIFLLIALVSEAQVPISGLPTYTGDPYGGWIPVVISGVTRKTASQNLGNLDSISVATGSTYDTLKVFKNAVLKYYKLVRAGSTLDTTSIYSAIGLKLNISDTTNKWITSVYRKDASDSVFFVKGGTHSFAFKDSTGGGGGSTDTSKWTLSGSTIYPKSNRLLGLGATTTAASPIHHSFPYGTTSDGNIMIFDPPNYGTNYPTGVDFGVADRFYMGIARIDANESGRPNVIGQFWGYNSSFQGARVNANDASFSYRTETNYNIGGTMPSFEFHMPEVISRQGNYVRLHSTYVSKSMDTSLPAYLSNGQWVEKRGIFKEHWIGYRDNPWAELQSAADNTSFTLFPRGNNHPTSDIGSIGIDFQQGTQVALGFNTNGAYVGSVGTTAGVLNLKGSSVRSENPIISTKELRTEKGIYITNSSDANVDADKLTAGTWAFWVTDAAGVQQWRWRNANGENRIAFEPYFGYYNTLGVKPYTEAFTGMYGSGTMYQRVITEGGISLLAAHARGVIRFSTGADETEKARIDSNGRFGIGVTNPTAWLHIQAGSATANTAPLKFTSGAASQTTKEAGAVNYDGSNLTLSDATYAYTLDKSLPGSATLDFGSTAAATSTDLTITVTGAADGDVVSLGVPNAAVSANSAYTAWVSAANTVTVRFHNYQTVGAIDPTSATFKVKVIK